MLYATYLYSTGDGIKTAHPRIAAYERTTIDGNPSYLDDDRLFGGVAKPPYRSDRLTAPGPGTPTPERHQSKGDSERSSFSKRDE